MPIYEWQCEFCSHFMERIQKDPKPPRCPECSGHMLRVPSRPGYRRDHTVIKDTK